MREQILRRIERLNEVGQQSFNGNDYTYGLNTWKEGTITLLRRIIPDNELIILQIQQISARRINLNRNDASAYNVEACKDQAREILQVLLDTLPNNDTTRLNQHAFWDLVHPRVRQLARRGFENNLFADAISACMREINTIVKNHVRAIINQELDGAPLMTRAFSVANPIIQLTDDLTTETGRNIQLGYMKIFEGSMIGIRNPKAHQNLYPDENKTIHLLFIASFMFIKLQEAGIITE